MEVINERQKKFAINFIIYLFSFIILCFIGIRSTYAISYTTIGDLSSNTVVYISTSYASSPFNVPKNSGYNFNSVLQIDYLINNYTFEANKHYQLETHLLEQRLPYANAYTVTGLNGESCLTDNYFVNFINNEYPRWDFQCPHNTNSITLTIYNSSGGYLWNGSGIYNWGTALLSYTSSSIATSDTDTIINNNNQNTQNIINNNNINTQQIIDSNKVCTTYASNSIFIDGKYLNINGGEGIDNTFGITDYIYFYNSDYTFSTYTNSWVASTCFYDSNKDLLSCTYNQNLNSFNIPNNAYYLRMSIKKTFDLPLLTICQNGNQALNDSINNLDDTINDDDTTDAENEASDFFNSFDTETFGLTSIITAPLNLIRSVIGDGSVCTTLHLPLPYLDNKYLDLPCMYGIYSNYFGTFFTIYQTITYGIVAYWVIVRIFNQVKDFKNPEHDEIEVMDL